MTHSISGLLMVLLLLLFGREIQLIAVKNRRKGLIFISLGIFFGIVALVIFFAFSLDKNFKVEYVAKDFQLLRVGHAIDPTNGFYYPSERLWKFEQWLGFKGLLRFDPPIPLMEFHVGREPGDKRHLIWICWQKPGLTASGRQAKGSGPFKSFSSAPRELLPHLYDENHKSIDLDLPNGGGFGGLGRGVDTILNDCWGVPVSRRSSLSNCTLEIVNYPSSNLVARIRFTR